MRKILIISMIQSLAGVLTPELLKQFADKTIDFAEEYVLGTKSSIDDRIVLPMCELIRRAFDITDND